MWEKRFCTGNFLSLCLRIYVFKRFLLMSFNAAELTGQTHIPEKQAPTKEKHFLPTCKMLQNFTERNGRKLTVS